MLDLVGNTSYGVASTNSAAANYTIIMQAFSDAAFGSKIGWEVFLRGGGAKYPCNGLMLPSEPITFKGGGPGGSFLKFPAGQQGLGYNNTVGSARWGDGFTYEPVWVVEGITFEGNFSGGNYGWYFPNWNSPSGTAINLVARDCKVTYFNGGGVYFLIGGIGGDGFMENLEVAHIDGDACFVLGSDFRGVNLNAHSNEYEGFYWPDGKNTQLDSIKAWNVGKSHHAGRTAGMHFAGGGQTIVNAYMQDCEGPAVYAVNSDGITITNLVSDRNNWNTTDGTAAVVVADSHNIRITGRNIKTANTLCAYSLKVTDSGVNNYANAIDLIHDTNGGFAMTAAVDPASNLNSTDVVISGSRGGVTADTFSATPSFDPYKSKGHTMTMSAAITSVTAANVHQGCELDLLFTQDGTGGWNLPAAGSWTNFVFTTNPSNTGNTLGKKTYFKFKCFDGTNWQQVSPANTWF